MKLEQVVRTSADVAETSSRRAKVDRLASCLASLADNEVPVAVAYLSGSLPHGSIGVGWATLKDVPPPAAPPPDLELLEVDTTLRRVGALAGPGSQAARREALHDLFAHATEPEQRFLRGLLTGEIRQGALEGVMVDAVARASGVPIGEVRRAAMLAGDLGTVAAASIGGGADALSRFRLSPMTPVLPMLAQSAEDVPAAFERIRPASVEWKLDGARIQVHRIGDDVRVYTRNLADVTARVPEIVESISTVPLDAAVFDAEAIALRSDGRPHPFGVTMSRFGSRTRRDLEQLRAEIPLRAFVFDVLHLDGDDLLDLPASERSAALEDRLPEELRVRRIVTDDVRAAEAFFEDALDRGHEGVMVKALDAPYEAGRRGAAWLKVKRAHTLDLVVLAAEWGHGRRQGWLSNLHLGARNRETGGYVMLGKTFKGMTDATLAWQTEQLQRLETHRDGITVHVRPELVVEIAFDGLQRSPRYPGGLALRFARLKGYRPDKSPADADTIDTVRGIFERGEG
ncbi:MAG TPA: ATP-dependent DNA ligase [Actinomycetota bacterium]|nr:ATP-dependent DNA ligase [Actinomycetota bacterium]